MSSTARPRLSVRVNTAPAVASAVETAEGISIATVTAALVTNSGRSAWFVGVLLLMVYLTFAMTLYLLPPRVA